MKSLSQDKLIDISYLSPRKWDKLDMVFQQPCLIHVVSTIFGLWVDSTEDLSHDFQTQTINPFIPSVP